MTIKIERLQSVTIEPIAISLPSPAPVKLQLIGPQGPAGPVGTVGPGGAAGTTGPQGPVGPQGVQGLGGLDGVNGIDGAPGVPGNDGAGYGGISTSSNSISTGSKNWVTQTDLAYVAGQRVRVANSSLSWMEGTVVSYVGTALAIDVTFVAGAGTFASWTISAAGEPGAGAVNSVNGLAGDVVLPVRDLLSAARTYYVRVDGADANDGLANSAAGAFLTIQKALDVVGGLDTVIYDVTIQIGDGTYTAANGRNVIKSPLGTGRIIIQGNLAARDNVVVAAASVCFTYAGSKRLVDIFGFKLTGANAAIEANGSPINTGNLNLATAGVSFSAANSGNIAVTQNYEISADVVRHVWARDQSTIAIAGRTVTLTGVIATSIFINVVSLSHVKAWSVTYLGSGTGTRYVATGNSVLELYGSVQPVDVAGYVSTGAVTI